MGDRKWLSGSDFSGRLEVETFNGSLLEILTAGPTASDAVALISTPLAFRVVSGAELLEGLVDGAFDEAFEVRCFDPYQEMRWMRDGAGGRACLLSEPELVDAEASIEFAAFNEIEYLLWGRGFGGRAVSSQRIGTLSLPIDVPDGARAVIRAREYIAADRYGNASVIEERLLSLEVER